MNTSNFTDKKLGIIQSRGIGDILIALPIAGFYHKQGYEIYWPICAEFTVHFEHAVPWVNWIPIPTDPRGEFFYDTPIDFLGQLGITEAICLYQSLSSHPEFSQRPEFQIMSFDQYKYAVSGVPFLEKWQLAQYITRDQSREQALYEQLVADAHQPYVVTHLTGSDHIAAPDLQSQFPSDWQLIHIDQHLTASNSIFDWITTLERARAIVTVDSVFANLVDQLGIPSRPVDCHFIPRSHIQLTPVLGHNWNILDPDHSTLKRISIFRSA